jgi:hypothetical protein
LTSYTKYEKIAAVNVPVIRKKRMIPGARRARCSERHREVLVALAVPDEGGIGEG